MEYQTLRRLIKLAVKKMPPPVRIFLGKVQEVRRLLFGPGRAWNWTDDHDYWEARYEAGGASGEGSVGEPREAKWGIISRYVDASAKSVLDVGCGDLSFWEGRRCDDYTGIDLSESVIEKDRAVRPEWKFLVADASSHLNVKGQVVLCLDMLFHIMSDDAFKKVLRNLSEWTEEWLFIVTWYRSPFAGRGTDGRYQYYRPLIKYLGLLSPLKLVAGHALDKINAMYVFRAKSV